MDRTHLVMHHLLRRSILTSPFIVREKTIHTDILILILFPASNKLELPFMEPMFMGQSSLQLMRSEEHTSELQSRFDLVCRLLLEKKKNKIVLSLIIIYLIS